MALRAVMGRWALSQSALARASGLPQPAISNILRGKSKGIDSQSLEKLLNGLYRIDPLAREAFWGALRLNRIDLQLIEVPDDELMNRQPTIIYSYENPEVLAELLQFLDGEGLLNKEALLKKEAEFNQGREIHWPIEHHLVMRLMMKRAEREKNENQR